MTKKVEMIDVYNVRQQTGMVHQAGFLSLEFPVVARRRPRRIDDDLLVLDETGRVPFMQWHVVPEAFVVLKQVAEKYPKTFANFTMVGPFIPIILLESLAKAIVELYECKLGEISQEEIANAMSTMQNLEEVHFNVDWLKKRLLAVKNLVHCDALEALRRNQQVEMESLRARMSLLEKEMALCEKEIAEAKKETTEGLRGQFLQRQV